MPGGGLQEGRHRQRPRQALFGGTWSEPVAAFVGYCGLALYVVGLLQWLLVRLPKNGRVAGGF